MNGLIAWWAKNSVAANLLMVACIIAGITAFTRMEREVFPSASFNGATISVAWPGASPQEVEEQIILRIEESIVDIDGVKHVISTAREGVASVNVEGIDTVDAATFLNEIKNRIDGISTLPQDAYPPIVMQWRAENPTQFIAIYGDLEPRELYRLGRDLRDELAQIPNGSPLVDIWGIRNEEVSIEVSEEALRSYGLTFDDVVRAISGSSLNLAGGQVRTDTGNIQLATRNLADSEEEFERIIIRQRPDGSTIRIRDVANVVDGFEDRKSIREMNGRPALTLAVQAPETIDIVALSKAVDTWLEEKNEQLNGKAELYIWLDFADLYFDRVNLITSNAAIGMFLVLIVLLLFLRPAVALWVTVGIAVSFFGAFIFLPAAGVSLNMLSLFAFLLVIGVVVDDAIIVGEAIHNQVEDGGSGVEAATLATQLVAKPVLFAVLTTMITFLPWLFLSGGTSQFTKHISYTIIFALTFSLVESFLILPSHLAHMKKQKKDGAYYRMQRVFAEGLMNIADTVYRPIIKAALKFRYFTVALFIGAFMVAAALPSLGWVGFKFMPEIQGSFLSLTVRMPEGSPWARSEQVFKDVEKAAHSLKASLDTPEKEFVRSIYVGADEEDVSAYLTIPPADERKQSTKKIAELFRDKLGDIPDAEEITISYTLNDGQPDLAFGIESDNLEELRLGILDLQNFLRTLPDTYDVRNNLQSATPELQVELKPGAERFGLTLAEISRQIRQAFYGDEVQRLPRDGQDVRVMVRYPKSDRESLTTIESMRIRTADGREVPLTVVADAKFAPSFKRIDRRDRQRSAQVTAELREGADQEAVMKIYREEFVPEFIKRHPGVSLAQRGNAEMQQEFIAEWMVLQVMALVAMYMLLAIAFSSYFQPLLVMSAIPFGFMGAAFGHFLFGLNFALFSFFGVAAAAGVVVNDNLVLIDYVNRLRANGEGAISSLVKAGVGRFRPILLTSLTTFVGLLPIMFERSTSAQFLMPTIVSLAFGVFFATFVTLLFVPAMYAVGADISRLYRWAWTGVKPTPVGHGASEQSNYGEATHAHDLHLDDQGRRKPLWDPAE